MGILFNYYHGGFLFTAKITMQCRRCMASFPAEDKDEHEVCDLCKQKMMSAHKNDSNMSCKLLSTSVGLSG